MKDVNMIFLCSIIALISVVMWNGYYIVIRNSDAKDVVFSYTTLLAAMIFFILNISFSLRNDEVVKDISSHLSHFDHVVDIHKNGINSFKSFFITFNREDISKILGIPKSEEVVTYDIDKMSSHVEKIVDYMKIALIGSMARDFYDWESEPIGNLKGSNGYLVSNEIDKNHEFFSHKKFINDIGLDLDEELLRKHNLSNFIKLPKHTKVYGTPNGVFFDNPHFLIKVEFYVDINTAWDVQYRANGDTYTIAEVKHPSDRVITYFCGVRYTEIFKSELAGSYKKAIYKNWSNKLFNYINDNFSLS